MEQINLGGARNCVDMKYVGFMPNTGKIKPVHVAGGSLRCIYGEYNCSKSIKKMAVVSNAKGVVPPGRDTETIYSELKKNEKIEKGISLNDVDVMRNAMQKLLSVDNGVFVIAKDSQDRMTSYSAGSKYFLTVTAMLEDAGEFIGSIIHNYCPELAAHIKGLLDEGNDPITHLFEPILEYDGVVFEQQNMCEDVSIFKNRNNKVEWFLKGVKDGGECLVNNLRHHSNPLTQLRLFNLFCIFNIFKYMALLEAFYCDGSIRPILLDFSGKNPKVSSIARASEMSYTQMCKSINRFYAWGYSKWLKENGYTKEELLKSATPIYTKSKKTNDEELEALWQITKDRVSKIEEEDAFLAFGETMNDMLASKTNAHPLGYLKALGKLSGILYPPDNFHPNKRFVVSQDVLEMLLRCCITPGEIISGIDIRERLWDRFGVIIGGSRFEMQKLQNSGMILQIDETALEENFSSFANTLESMDFAEIMADGILQIRLGGNEK